MTRTKTRTDFFAACTTLEDLKRTYHALALQHHPDRGGDLETMQAINTAYDLSFPRLKDIHRAASGKTYAKATTEAPEEYRDLIDRLIKLQGIKIEIIGCFMWVSGDTKPHKDTLKTLGLRWHATKAVWYKSPPGYRRSTKKDLTLDQIRARFDHATITADDQAKAPRPSAITA
ncbi:MAG: molecular chaperone DnaJ [Christensenellales bacterium]